jgi:hypothetical protein
MDQDETFEVPPELEAELLESIAEADRGETISAEELIERLRRTERRDLLVDNPALAEAVRTGWITPAEIVSDEPPLRLPVAPLRELLQELDEDREDR